MSKFHTTVNRREFMKGLGLAGAGIGAAALVAPNFKDIDELAASHSGNFKHAWWVREREAYNPTVDVDWDQIKPWKRGPTNPKQTPKYLEQSAYNKATYTDVWTAEKLEGYDIKFSALKSAANYWKGTNPDDLGWTKVDSADRWTGTPEEGAGIIRAAMSYLGSPEVHFLKIDDKTRSLFTKDASTQDIEDGKCKNIILSLNRKDIALSRRGGNDPYSYSHTGVVARRMQTFLNGLGYNCLPVPNPSNVAFSVLAGGAELSRIDHGCSPRFGMGMKTWNIYATDMDLPAENPIDAGITKFCYTCKVCAEICEMQALGVNALSMETEPTWDLPNNLPAADGSTADYKRPGVKKWFADYAYCTCILRCWTQCTFNQLNHAFAHDLIRASIPYTTVMNGFYSQMDRLFDYGVKTYEEIPEGIETWWNRDLGTWIHDTQEAGDNVQ
ncbi:MAG: reductive dehalogenase domain-containing protein [Dehalogenimonas sp.]|uniref:Reductive dehalogenase domain-containing protein n=1 Tax=Candidatus Dehalogenimonas loeffleri TaxID=3127115 RepID=A0ABZ2JBX0_9CHLR|nr:reductive dehalogenase domain-containing protein [Dehalogenimonas sp.]